MRLDFDAGKREDHLTVNFELEQFQDTAVKLAEEARAKRSEVTGKLEYEINFGDRQLDLYINDSDPDHLSASTYILSSSVGQPVANQTTILYLTAQRIMRRHANESGKVVHYTLRTPVKSTRPERSPTNKMLGWADNQGKEIFQWRSKEIYKIHDMVYKAEIVPEH